MVSDTFEVSDTSTHCNTSSIAFAFSKHSSYSSSAQRATTSATSKTRSTRFSGRISKSLWTQSGRNPNMTALKKAPAEPRSGEEAPMTRPVASKIGEMLRETSIRLPVRAMRPTV